MLNFGKLKSRLLEFFRINTIDCTKLVMHQLKSDNENKEALDSLLKNNFTEANLELLFKEMTTNFQTFKDNIKLDRNSEMTEDDIEIFFKDWSFVLEFEDLRTYLVIKNK